MQNKIITAGLFVAVFTLLSAVLFFNASPDTAWSGEDKINHATLKVEGMTCASCAPTVKMVLKKLDGVLKADVNVKEEKAEVDYQEGKVTVDQMIKAVNDIGFKTSLSQEGRK